MPRSRQLLAALLVAAAAVGCRPVDEGDGSAPRLVVVLVVDQLRYDYLVRYRELLTGGLDRLLDQGLSFTEAHHAHAMTATAPGHAALVTGQHPSRHGIIGNSWIDPWTHEMVYSVYDPVYGASPKLLESSTLGDWAKRANRRTKVYAASRKDRSAVLLGGKRADAAFWYDSESGDFETNRYYRLRPPRWLADFNELGLLAARFGSPWEPLPLAPDSVAAAELSEVPLGPLGTGFPHVAGGLSVEPSPGFFSGLAGTPFVDDHLEAFAEQIVLAADLGADAHVDVLGLSFSALDAVGHRYGPDSREALDTLLRLDRSIGRLLAFLDDRVGADHYVAGFSADHGVMDMPEVRESKGLAGRRVSPEETLCFQGLANDLSSTLGEGSWIERGRFFNRALAEEEGVAIERLEELAVAYLERCPGIERVWTRSALAEAGDDDPKALQFARNTHPERSPDLQLQFEEQYLPTRSIEASHGSSHRYDSHVPLILWGAGVPAGNSSEPVWTVDLAPSLAALAGIPTPEDLAGRNLVSEVAGEAP